MYRELIEVLLIAVTVPLVGVVAVLVVGKTKRRKVTNAQRTRGLA